MDKTEIMSPADIMPVLASIEPVVARSSLVSLDLSRLDQAVAGWGDRPEAQSGWQHPCHYFDDTEETVRWIFILDVLNHCFWPDSNEPVWNVSHRGILYSGYWGLAAALRKALEQGIPLTRAEYLADISLSDVKTILSGISGKLPLLEQRHENLREAGRVLLADWRGDIVNLLRKTAGNAVLTVSTLASAFSGFRDEAFYEGLRVIFWKRAQIFVADLHAAFAGSRWGHFDDIDRLTAFADYKLPQVLREMGILSYHPDLASAIDSRKELLPGSREEVEIRAATIAAVEALKGAFSRTGRRMTASQIDSWLWQLGQMDSFRSRPYHRCRTIYY
ncbi:MAG: queuosine salvage family protein [Syntrophobacteraceae bacterium]|nr:queuosine salvage family protein [Desulfobacteraceae bacterium]